MRNDISINFLSLGRTSAAISALILLAACATTSEETTPQPAEPPAAAPVPETAAPPAAEAVELQPNAPLRYVVQKGDTLWSISHKFLQDPWQWPELWYANDQVKNPHLIYPGDVLYLYWANGQPRLAKEGEGGEGGMAPVAAYTGPTDKLSPRARELPLGAAIGGISRDIIGAFLHGPRIIDDEDVLDDAPYLLDFDDPHLVSASPTTVYVLDMEDTSLRQFQVVRKGKRYVDPDDGDTIGYEAVPVAHAEVKVFGDPSTVSLLRSDIEAKPGDRLIPIDPQDLDAQFFPHAPTKAVEGTIIDVFNGDANIGQYQIIVINRGKEQGIEPGHVLSVLQSGRRSPDPYSAFGSKVRLPEINAGTVMVFKSTERASLALVMTALRQIHVGDKVEKPEASDR